MYHVYIDLYKYKNPSMGRSIHSKNIFIFDTFEIFTINYWNIYRVGKEHDQNLLYKKWTVIYKEKNILMLKYSF